MNKPISKHALRRAMEKVEKEGFLQYSEPIGTVVDRIWHEVEKSTYSSGRKKTAARTTTRTPTIVKVPEDVS